MKEIAITREDLFGNEEQQREVAQATTDNLEALPISSACGYKGKRVLVGIRDFANQTHIGWVVNDDYLTFKDRIKYLYILSYELKIRQTLEGKNTRTLIYQEETDDDLFQRRICFLNRDFKNDPDMFNENAIGYKTKSDCNKNMLEKFIGQSKVKDPIVKNIFAILLDGNIKKLEDISHLPSKEEGERILAEVEKKGIEEAKKRDLEELQKELKDLPEHIRDLTPKQFKKAFNIVAYRYHAYKFEDACGFERFSEKGIRMNLTKKMWFVCDSAETKLYYKDEDIEVGITGKSKLDLSRAKTVDIKELFEEIHDIFEYRFPNILNRGLFLKYVLRDFHKYFHGMSAW